jgi:hypothetical protein
MRQVVLQQRCSSVAAAQFAQSKSATLAQSVVIGAYFLYSFDKGLGVLEFVG